MNALSLKIEYFKNYQRQIMEAEHKLRSMSEEYRAELKATFGITDGEQANALDLVVALHKMQEIK